MKRTLLERIFKWRFDRLHISFEKWRERFEAAEPLSKTRAKCLKKQGKIIREREWLLNRMYTM